MKKERNEGNSELIKGGMFEGKKRGRKEGLQNKPRKKYRKKH